MVKVIMHGCNGHMGQVITQLVEKDPEIEIVAGIDLNDCRDNGYPVFTDIWEFQKYAQGKGALRSIQIPFTQLEKFEGKQAKAYMLNPMGFSIPLTKEMIPKLMKKFGLEGDQK